MDLDEMTDKGIVFISLQDNIDLSTSGGRFMAHMLGAVAEFERDIIRERTMAGLERAKAKGKKLGRPKGSKDKGQRARSGYWDRYKGKSKKQRKRGGKKSPPVKDTENSDETPKEAGVAEPKQTAVIPADNIGTEDYICHCGGELEHQGGEQYECKDCGRIFISGETIPRKSDYKKPSSSQTKGVNE